MLQQSVRLEHNFGDGMRTASVKENTDSSQSQQLLQAADHFNDDSCDSHQPLTKKSKKMGELASTEDMIRDLPKVSIILSRQRLNDIRITTPKPGIREITYYGIDDSTSGPRNCLSGGGRRYREWRSVTIPAIPRKGISKSTAEDKDVSLKICPEFPTMFYESGYKDDIHSILDVLTGQKMTTAVLDAFFIRRLKSHNTNLLEVEETAIFKYLPLHFLPIFDRDQDIENTEPNMMYFPDESLKDDSVVVAPLYLCEHFYLAIFYLMTRKVKVFDSSWEFFHPALRYHQVERITNFLPKVSAFEDDSWDIIFVNNCAQQKDEYSCGCYVIYFLENELTGNEKNNKRRLSDTQIARIRYEVVEAILPTTTIGTKFLDAITI